MRKCILFASLAVIIGLSLPVQTGQAQDRPRLIASFSILADVARQVAGDAADVEALIPVDTDPHSFTPTPRDLVALAGADAVFLVGAAFEESLTETIANAGPEIALVIASTCVPILPFGASATDVEAHNSEITPTALPPELAAVAEQCQAHQAEIAALYDEPAAGAVAPLGPLYALSCGGGHEAGGCDPHVWTDPRNAMLWALMIRDTLAALDPANAEVYAANAGAYVARLADLAASVWLPALHSVPEAGRKLLTNHGSLGYLANWAGYEIVGLVIPSASSLAESSAAETAALIDLIRARSIPAIFTETTLDPRLAGQIAAETGVTLVTLYTGTLSGPDGPAPTYEAYMDYNIRAIVEALGGTIQP